MAKWALVAAGVKDLSRPADKLSVSQNVALAATGFIWVSRPRPHFPYSTKPIHFNSLIFSFSLAWGYLTTFDMKQNRCRVVPRR